ncbi:tail protein [Burkholderia phage BcepSaruman]|uniref:Tail protein n=1 Tax=Burkholderia phage BcepSaruman TaxID=2530032 RepID=A0A4D5ZD89_9CAUD|nr:tail protein [Burkholderia phage BcepSaruman]QBX06669.1 tail protein [Burkholderia phage BcepSaruman]
MDLETFIDHTMYPNEQRVSEMEWTLSGLANWGASGHNSSGDGVEHLISWPLFNYLKQSGYLDNGESRDGFMANVRLRLDKILKRFVKKRLKKWFWRFLRKVLKKAVRILWNAARWIIENTFRAIIRLLVRPLIVGVLELIGLNPELWPFIAVAGGIAVGGWWAWNKFFGDKAHDTTGTIVDTAMTVVGPSGAEAPIGAGAPMAANAPGTRYAPATELSGLIARGEGDYNVVNYGTRVKDKKKRKRAGTEDLENMTVNEVMQHQQAGDFNAAGRYQIITDTMPEIVRGMGLTGNEKFDRTTQDRMFNYLITVKRRPIGDYISGRSNDLNAAIYAASMEWASVAAPAGMPLFKKKKTDVTRYGDGETSYYSGVQGNRASIPAIEMGEMLERERIRAAGGQTQTQQSTVQTRDGTTMAQADAVKARQRQAQPRGAPPPQQQQKDKEIILGKNGELINVTS